MATLPSITTPKTDQLGPTADDALDLRKRNEGLLQQVTSCKQYRRKLVREWATSIDFRRGKPFASQADEDRISVNLDWSFTKQKQALLFSQVPAIRVDHPPHTISQEALPWVHAFEQRINDTAVQAGIETAMDECLPDCINAAGLGIIMVAREAITEDVDVPSIDMSAMPSQIHTTVMQSGMMPDGSPIPMSTIPRVVDSRYVTMRISPADFLWPINYTGSDFDQAPWVGRSGRITWPEAMKRFKLKPEDKIKYLGEDRTPMDRLNNDLEKDKSQAYDMVSFDELYYKEYQFDPEAKSFTTIHHIVFINNSEKPVIDEPWEGQQFDQESNQLIGALRYPIRVLTLSYITDEAIPPSDSAMARPQVQELNKSRTNMMQQREHSKPIRWFDVNRLDPAIQQALMRGVWQHMVPVQGQGTNVIGEVPRSALPQENYMFDKVAKADAAEIWQVGQGEAGADIETKAEVQAVSSNMQTRISRERAKVGKFFCSIAEVLGGLLCIYEDPSAFGQGFTPLVSRTLSYSILADSTVLLDSNQRLKRLIDFMNFTAKSGQVNIKPVLQEIATLSGLDPNIVIIDPAPRPPVEPNVSLRLTGLEDMMNPLTLAFLMKSGQAPSTDLIEQAKKLIDASVTPPVAPGLVRDPNGGVMVDNGQPPPQTPSPAPPAVGDAHPNWAAMSRINKRTVDRSE